MIHSYNVMSDTIPVGISEHTLIIGVCTPFVALFMAGLVVYFIFTLIHDHRIMSQKLESEYQYWYKEDFHSAAPDPEPNPRARRPHQHTHDDPPAFGRRPSSQKMDALHVLGLDAGASASDISTAFRKLVKQHYPDADRGEKNARIAFQKIVEARDLLLA